MQYGTQRDCLSERDRPSGLTMPKTHFSRRKWLKEISVPVYILVMLFALASWIDINGLWVELPLLVLKLPEGWKLPSVLSIIIQVANIGPILYTFANWVAPNKVKEWPVIYFIIVVGAVACLLLSFFWDHTSYIRGQEHSVHLIALSSLLALVDTTSSVVFLPYMAVFKEHYMSAFYIGEGMSGLIPGLVGLIQGVGTNSECRNISVIVQNMSTGVNLTEYRIEPIDQPPVFSVTMFFYFLFGMLVVSCLAFSFLHFSPYCKKEKVAYEGARYQENILSETQEQEACNTQEQTDCTTQEYNAVKTQEQIACNDVETDELRANFLPDPHNVSDDDVVPAEFKGVIPNDTGRNEGKPALTFTQVAFLLAVSAWVNAMANGLIAATQSFSSLPYSNMAYTLSVRLSAVANPLACLLALFLPSKSITRTAVLTLLGTIGAAYQLVLAACSPTPPLVGTAMGEFLVISTAVLMTGFFSYAKVSVAIILRDGGRKSLLWCGISQQVGSLVGAVFAFILVNVLKLFESAPPCAKMISTYT